MRIKNIKLLAAFFALTVLFSGCSKEENEKSKVTFLPDVSIIGDFYTIVIAGDDYTELGAVATEAGQPIDYTITGNVDTNEPGVYILTYSGTNVDGFEASATRIVFVLPEAFIDGSADISGNYKLAANARPSTVTKIADGVYAMSDGWGTATSSGNPSPIPCYLFCTDGVNIIMPNYPTVFGGMEGTGVFNGSSMTISTTLVDQGPLTRIRVWNKQ